MKSILTLVSLLIGSQAIAGQVTCDVKNSPTQVKLTIASTSLVSGEHTIVITANGFLESTYELKPISVNQSRTLVSVKASSDIGYFIRPLPSFEINPLPPPKVTRIVEAQLDLETIDSGSDGFLTNMASGIGKLTLTGDLSDAYPKLAPQYELESCVGELN